MKKRSLQRIYRLILEKQTVITLIAKASRQRRSCNVLQLLLQVCYCTGNICCQLSSVERIKQKLLLGSNKKIPVGASLIKKVFLWSLLLGGCWLLVSAVLSNSGQDGSTSFSCNLNAISLLFFSFYSTHFLHWHLCISPVTWCFSSTNMSVSKLLWMKEEAHQSLETSQCNFDHHTQLSCYSLTVT